MSMTDPVTILEPEGIFHVRKQTHSQAVMWLLAGIGLLGFAVLGFLVAIVGRVNQLSLHSMTTFPTMLSLGAFWAAWIKFHAPREVGVGPQGIRIDQGRESRSYGWDQIGWSSTQTGTFGFQRSLRVFDVKGRKIADLSDSIEDFDDMVDLIAKRIAAKGDQTASQIQLSKAKRTATLAAVAGVLGLAISGALAWHTRDEIRAARMLERSAVPGRAQIERRFLAPNGVTPRVIYRVTTPDGRSATHNAEVERRVWNALEGAQTVPVLYVPEEPVHQSAPDRRSRVARLFPGTTHRLWCAYSRGGPQRLFPRWRRLLILRLEHRFGFENRPAIDQTLRNREVNRSARKDYERHQRRTIRLGDNYGLSSIVKSSY
jgi:hypothetical protein